MAAYSTPLLLSRRCFVAFLNERMSTRRPNGPNINIRNIIPRIGAGDNCVRSATEHSAKAPRARSLVTMCIQPHVTKSELLNNQVTPFREKKDPIIVNNPYENNSRMVRIVYTIARRMSISLKILELVRTNPQHVIGFLQHLTATRIHPTKTGIGYKTQTISSKLVIPNNKLERSNLFNFCTLAASLPLG